MNRNKMIVPGTSLDKFDVLRCFIEELDYIFELLMEEAEIVSDNEIEMTVTINKENNSVSIDDPGGIVIMSFPPRAGGDDNV